MDCCSKKNQVGDITYFCECERKHYVQLFLSIFNILIIIIIVLTDLSGVQNHLIKYAVNILLEIRKQMSNAVPAIFQLFPSIYIAKVKDETAAIKR